LLASLRADLRLFRLGKTELKSFACLFSALTVFYYF
jgi:hypothetical protein